MKRETLDVVRGSGNVFRDLGHKNADVLQLKAILAAEIRPDLRVTLVESDQRKATFLRHAAQELHLQATVITDRIESITPLQADVISARALAPLSTLLGFAERHGTRSSIAVLPKGARHAEELDAAKKAWTFDLEIKDSLSDTQAAILLIRKITRAKHD